MSATILVGRSVRYFRQLGQGANDPTMVHVDAVRWYVGKVLEYLDREGCVSYDVEWLDEYTCRITLAAGWRFTN